MVEVRWAVQGKKTKREGGGGGSKGGGKKKGDTWPFSLKVPPKDQSEEPRRDEGKKSGPAGVPLSKALQISQVPLVIQGIMRQFEA